MEELLTPAVALSFVTLSLLEIVLGIDNLIFIALVVQNLPENQQKKARLIGLSLAMAIRIAMLLGISWLMQLTEPLFTMFEVELSIKDLLMLAGGGFLIAKATFEMHADLAGPEEHKEVTSPNGFSKAVFQITLIDIIFSFDSVITAVGLSPHIPVIIAAIAVSMLVMILASGYLSRFLQQHPAFKMLALSFILMIGTMLVADGLHFHIPRGYIYFSFAFAIGVEILNTLATKRRHRLQQQKQKIT